MNHAVLLASYSTNGVAVIQEELREKKVTVAHVVCHAPTEETALDEQMGRLNAEKVDSLVVLPLFMAPGKTWTAFQKEIEAYRGVFRMNILPPFLSVPENREHLARILSFEEGKRYLMVGHGSGNLSDNFYRELEPLLPENVQVALLEGKPSVEETVAQWDTSLPLVVVPLLMTAGHHMWEELVVYLVSSLTAKGYTVSVSAHALLEDPAFRRLVLDQLPAEE